MEHLVFKRRTFDYGVFQSFQRWIREYPTYTEKKVGAKNLTEVKRRYQAEYLDRVVADHLLCYWRGIPEYVNALTVACQTGQPNGASELWCAGYVVGELSTHNHGDCRISKNSCWCFHYYLIDYTFRRDENRGGYNHGLVMLAGHQETLLSIPTNKELQTYRLFFLDYLRGSCTTKERRQREDGKKYAPQLWSEQSELFAYYPEHNRYYLNGGLFTPGYFDTWYGPEMSRDQISLAISRHENRGGVDDLRHERVA